MRAARFHRFGGLVQIDEVEDPHPGPNDVIVRVKCCQIGGDILKVLAGTGPVRRPDEFVFPHTPGYRGAGIVDVAGSAVETLTVGDRVVINGFVNCGECEACRRGNDNLCERAAMLGIDSGMPGAMAELVKAPARVVFGLPDGVSFEQSTLLPNMALVVHAYRRANVKGPFTTAIFGCGLVGSGALAVAKALGATQIFGVDIYPAVLERAEAYGATHVINAAHDDPVDAILRATGADGVDVALELVGIGATIQNAVRCTRSRGVALLIGALGETSISFPEYYRDVIQREVDLRACFGKSQADFARAVELVRRGALDLSAYRLRTQPFDAIHAAIREAGDPTNNDVHLVTLT